MTKIGMISPKGKPSMVIYYDEKAAVNPYKVYLEWKELGNYGLRGRKKRVAMYGDLLSCGVKMAEYTAKNNEEGR